MAARLFLLLERPLWHDELFTAWVARLSPAALVDALRTDSGPPLFYLLEWPFARAGDSGDRDALLRLLPFLAGLILIAAVPTLPRGAARLWWLALAAGFALGNLYAAEARAYSLLSPLCLGTFLLTLRGKETPARSIGAAAMSAAALWTHYLALFAVAAAFLLALFRRRFRSAFALAAGFALFAPWLPVLAAQPPAAMAWLLDPPARSLEGFLSALGGVGRIPAPFGRDLPAAIPLAGLAIGAALILLVSQSRQDPETRSGLAFVLLVLGLSLAASFWRPIAFAGRSEMAVLAVWTWTVARAARDRSRLSLRVAAALGAAFGLGATLFVALGPHPRPTSSAAVARIARVARAGDVVLAGPGFYLPARLAEDRGLLTARVESLPAGDSAHPGWFIAWPLSPEDVTAALRIAEALPAGSRLFLLLPPAYSAPVLMTPLRERGTLRELVRQSDGVLTSWTPRRPGSP